MKRILYLLPLLLGVFACEAHNASILDNEKNTELSVQCFC